MSDFKINTKCLVGGYKPGNGEPRQIPIIQSTTFKYDTSEGQAVRPRGYRLFLLPPAKPDLRFRSS